MSGTIKGGLKAAETNYLLHGIDFYREIGRKGGLKKTPKGFSMMTPERRSACGRVGGSISRRGKARHA